MILRNWKKKIENMLKIVKIEFAPKDKLYLMLEAYASTSVMFQLNSSIFAEHSCFVKTELQFHVYSSHSNKSTTVIKVLVDKKSPKKIIVLL